MTDQTNGAEHPEVSEHATALERASTAVMAQAADKLIDQSSANIVAAEEALRLLKENHEALSSEVRKLAELHSKRLTEYLTTVHLATTVMATHRETMMTVAQSIGTNGGAEVEHGRLRSDQGAA